MNAECPDFLRIRVLRDIKGNGWLRQGLCPSCHIRVRHRSRMRQKVRYVKTNRGEEKRTDEMDSLPLVIAES